MELIFVNKDINLIRKYEEIIGPGIKNNTHIFIAKDINTIATPEYPVDYIVSTANNHDLDEVYSHIFPGIGLKVRAAIKKKYPETKLLPVGECLSVTIDEMCHYKDPCIVKLISCPIMTVSSDIANADNVYRACKSLFSLLKNQQRKVRVIIPSIETSIGRFSPEESARQILQALTETY